MARGRRFTRPPYYTRTHHEAAILLSSHLAKVLTQSKITFIDGLTLSYLINQSKLGILASFAKR